MKLPFRLKNFLAGVVLGFLVLSFFGLFNVLAARARIPAKTFVWGQDLSGRREKELEEFLVSQEERLAGVKFAFVFSSGGEDLAWEISGKDLSLKMAELSKKEVRGITRGVSLWQKLFFPKERIIVPRLVFAEDKLESLLAAIGGQISISPKDALFVFEDKKVKNFQPSENGRAFLKEKAKQDFLGIINSLGAGGDLEGEKLLTVSTQEAFPKVKTEDSNRLGIKEFLAKGESYFLDSIPGRVHNILLASLILHGQVAAPGETFSFNERIGKVSREAGYRQAYVIKEGKTVLDDGGGVCQVSSTLFRAALAAGVPIVERRAHSYRVSFYEQGGFLPGIDATVFPPWADFKFKNDTPAYILIQTQVDQEKKKLAIELYGTSDGRQVEMTQPKIWDQKPPPEPVYQDDPALPIGVTKQIDKPHWGAKTVFEREVIRNGESLIKESFYSHFIPWAAVFLRGTGPTAR